MRAKADRLGRVTNAEGVCQCRHRIFGANDWLVDEMYEQYLQDPSSVDPAWVEYFKTNKPGSPAAPSSSAPTTSAPQSSSASKGVPPIPKAQQQAAAPVAPAPVVAAPVAHAAPAAPAPVVVAPVAPAAPVSQPIVRESATAQPTPADPIVKPAPVFNHTKCVIT
jgi:multifunctional 2-oxoglutarate metabolism enzyme